VIRLRQGSHLVRRTHRCESRRHDIARVVRDGRQCERLLRRARTGRRRDLPAVRRREEGTRLRDVVLAERRGLDREDVSTGNAGACEWPRASGSSGETSTEGGAVRLQDRVVGVVRVEGHGAAVGVDDDLDGVANVVEAVGQPARVDVQVRRVLAVGY